MPRKPSSNKKPTNKYSEQKRRQRQKAEAHATACLVDQGEADTTPQQTDQLTSNERELLSPGPDSHPENTTAAAPEQEAPAAESISNTRSSVDSTDAKPCDQSAYTQPAPERLTSMLLSPEYRGLDIFHPNTSLRQAAPANLTVPATPMALICQRARMAAPHPHLPTPATLIIYNLMTMNALLMRKLFDTPDEQAKLEQELQLTKDQLTLRTHEVEDLTEELDDREFDLAELESRLDTTVHCLWAKQEELQQLRNEKEAIAAQLKLVFAAGSAQSCELEAVEQENVMLHAEVKHLRQQLAATAIRTEHRDTPYPSSADSSPFEAVEAEGEQNLTTDSGPSLFTGSPTHFLNESDWEEVKAGTTTNGQ